MAHQASAAGAGAPHPAEASAGAAARPRAASGDATVDADGTRWVPAGTSLPGVYVLSREGASAPSAAKAREADGAIRGLPPLFDDGADPIHRLAKDGDVDGLKLAASQAVAAPADAAGTARSFTAQDEDGRTPLHWAAAMGRDAAVAWLLAREDVSPRTADKAGWTPLHSAVSAGHTAVVARLLAAGADAAARTSQGRTPLHYCKGRALMVETLLGGEPDLDAADETGTTALMRCAASGAAEACRLLVEAGAAVDATDSEGWTALLHAAESSQLGAASVLILEGSANFKAQTRDGKTAGDLIDRSKLQALADIVRTRMARDGSGAGAAAAASAAADALGAWPVHGPPAAMSAMGAQTVDQATVLSVPADVEIASLLVGPGAVARGQPIASVRRKASAPLAESPTGEPAGGHVVRAPDNGILLQWLCNDDALRLSAGRLAVFAVCSHRMLHGGVCAVCNVDMSKVGAIPGRPIPSADSRLPLSVTRQLRSSSSPAPAVPEGDTPGFGPLPAAAAFLTPERVAGLASWWLGNRPAAAAGSSAPAAKLSGRNSYHDVKAVSGFQLQVASHEAEQADLRTQSRLLRARRLRLVLDIDHTLLHATCDERAAVIVSSCGLHTFEGEGVPYFVKLRPAVRTFLRLCQPFFELSVDTAGTRAYARRVVAVLDPTGDLFGQRIVTRSDHNYMQTQQKSAHWLHRSLGDASMMVVLDDTAAVWGRTAPANLVQIEPYKFFGSFQDVNNSAGVSATALDAAPSAPGAAASVALVRRVLATTTEEQLPILADAFAVLLWTHHAFYSLPPPPSPERLAQLFLMEAQTQHEAAVAAFRSAGWDAEGDGDEDGGEREDWEMGDDRAGEDDDFDDDGGGEGIDYD
ncbi:hypothetical protein FNF29_07333 [Cafeteria roenbergensis]|uniref:FCP1 homology domain-containing protein n=1 Tax=Cafeteria roenbergensis TaxID=33653 RepID=A0A5A8C494_CAFRO|nr:hypothetical protein FNF29_07333 [Cafeteria roenbergensis]|eukprot:KAA0147487.1 hypothetical protein FNF29_07333 [Cafeteria roenbergensis]